MLEDNSLLVAYNIKNNDRVTVVRVLQRDPPTDDGSMSGSDSTNSSDPESDSTNGSKRGADNCDDSEVELPSLKCAKTMSQEDIGSARGQYSPVHDSQGTGEEERKDAVVTIADHKCSVTEQDEDEDICIKSTEGGNIPKQVLVILVYPDGRQEIYEIFKTTTVLMLLHQLYSTERINRGSHIIIRQATILDTIQPLVLQKVQSKDELYIVKSSTKRLATCDSIALEDCGGVYIVNKDIFNVHALDNIAFISAGPEHKAAIDHCRRLYTWGGSKAYGAHGHNGGPSIIGLVNGLVNVATVCCGGSFTVVLDTSGRHFAWGVFLNKHGLSVSVGGRDRPVAMSALLRSGEVFEQIAAGFAHFLAMTSQGRVFSCGLGEQHQLGRTVCNWHLNQHPQLESISLANVKSIACGYFNSFALDNDGVVWAWGLNDQGQTGIPPEYRQTIRAGQPMTVLKNAFIERPTAVKGLDKKVIHISAAQTHAVFVFEDGSIKCVGMGVMGIDTHGLSAVKSVAASEDAYLVLTTDDRIFKYVIDTVCTDTDSDSSFSQDNSSGDGEENGSDDTDSDSDSTDESSNIDIQTGNKVMSSGWEELEYPFKLLAIAVGMVLAK